MPVALAETSGAGTMTMASLLSIITEVFTAATGWDGLGCRDRRRQSAVPDPHRLHLHRDWDHPLQPPAESVSPEGEGARERSRAPSP